jgi:hypothetical protein
MRKTGIHQDLRRGYYVEELRQETVSSCADAMNIYKIGTKNRTVGETAMNNESSRSHSVLTISLETKQTDTEHAKICHSQLHLIDLAVSDQLTKITVQITSFLSPLLSLGFRTSEKH